MPGRSMLEKSNIWNMQGDAVMRGRILKWSIFFRVVVAIF